MQPRRTLLLNVFVAFGLVLSGALTDFPFSARSDAARASAPVVQPEEFGGPILASKRRQRKQHRQDDRRNDQAQERPGNRKHADCKHDRKLKECKNASRVDDGEAFCTVPESIQLTKSEGCTHGPDPAPRGFDFEQPMALSRQRLRPWNPARPAATVMARAVTGCRSSMCGDRTDQAALLLYHRPR